MFDLTGLHLLVTRPQEQAVAWIPQLLQLGARATQLPCLVIQPLRQPADQQAIINHILKLDEYIAAIFVSQNAAKFGAQWIDRYWPQLPHALPLLSIGETTAQHLQQTLGVMGESSASFNNTKNNAMNSEALLAHPLLQQVEGKKVVIFRGQDGRTHLAEVLQSRGATVDYCELYQRQIPATINTDHWLEYKNTDDQPITVVHSGETLGNLCQLLSTDDKHWLYQQPILVPGNRVAQQAQTQGFEQIIMATNATHQSMTEALHDWRKRQR